jgi:hypothetical protein
VLNKAESAIILSVVAANFLAIGMIDKKIGIIHSSKWLGAYI